MDTVDGAYRVARAVERLGADLARAVATGAALGPWAYSLCLAAGGFVASTAGDGVTQPDGALTAIRWGFGLLPAAAMLVALLPQRRYTLTRRPAQPTEQPGLAGPPAARPTAR
ncbi:hypothetical protein ACGF7U_17620 [Micromonospora sp. NPDC047670]|uniref:hypothetical protein n=1 Tax=Micromonospora sp. NPDC047670 TaxID=3364252 RepID=UPI0037175D56